MKSCITALSTYLCGYPLWVVDIRNTFIDAFTNTQMFANIRGLIFYLNHFVNNKIKISTINRWVKYFYNYLLFVNTKPRKIKIKRQIFENFCFLIKISRCAWCYPHSVLQLSATINGDNFELSSDWICGWRFKDLSNYPHQLAVIHIEVGMSTMRCRKWTGSCS